MDIRDLALLSEDDLKDLGVALGPRRRILNALAASTPPANLPEQPARPPVRPAPAIEVIGREANLGDAAERRQLTIMF